MSPHTPTVTITVHGGCRDCGARVLWTLTAAHGRPMPLDPAPHPELGNVVLVRAASGARLIAVVLGRADAARRRARGEHLYLHHRVSCPGPTTGRDSP